MRVGDVVKQGNKFKVHWVNYSISDSPLGVNVIFEDINGVFAQVVKTDFIKKINKKIGELLVKKQLKEAPVFILKHERKLSIWVVDKGLINDLIKINKYNIKNALSAFLKCFLLRNIKLIIINDNELVFENNYELKGGDRLTPKHFFLEINRNNAKFQLSKSQEWLTSQQGNIGSYLK